MGLGLIAMTAAVAALPPFAEPLNRELFLEPATRSMHALEIVAPMRPDVRAVVFDDKSLVAMGREPTFADWWRVTRVLTDLGVERFYLLDSPVLKADIGSEPVTEQRVTSLYTGALAVVGSRSKREVPRSSVSRHLFLRAFESSMTEASDPRTPTHLFVPATSIQAASAGLGSLEYPVGHQIALARSLGDGLVLPLLAAWVLPELGWRDGALASRGRRVGASPDGTVYVEYGARSDLGRAIVPLAVFYDRDRDGVIEPQGAPERMRSVFAGVEDVLLVPQGFTGARFVDSPVGPMPSYTAVLSMMSRLKDGRVMHRPRGYTVLALFFGVFYAWCSRRARTKIAVIGCLGVAFMSVAFGALALWLEAIVLPVAASVCVAGVATGVRLVTHLLETLRRRVALERDLELGQAAQELLLSPTRAGDVGPWSYRIRFAPYGPMSGDWFQVWQSPEGASVPALVVALGDVVGKGPSAALVTTAVAVAWAQASERWSAGDLRAEAFLDLLDGMFRTTFKGRTYSTVSIAVLTPEDVVLTSINGPAWMVFDRSALDVRDIRTPSPRMLGQGVADASAYRLQRIARRDVDVLCVATDGAFEGTAARVALRAKLRKTSFAGMNPLEAIESLVVDAGAAHVLADDATVLTIVNRGNAARVEAS